MKRKKNKSDVEIPRGQAFIADKGRVHGTPSDTDRTGPRGTYAASSVIKRGTAAKLAADQGEEHTCLCGCGQQPSQVDSLFMPGHDSKVRAMGKAIGEGRLDISRVYKPAVQYLREGGMIA